MAGESTAEVQGQLAWAQTRLLAAGFDVQAAVEAGEPEIAVPNYLKIYSADLLVMGADEHSRIRQLIVGSMTLLRPVRCRSSSLADRSQKQHHWSSKRSVAPVF